MHDLLHDPLIGIRTDEGETAVSLPELLARLSAGTTLAFTGLRAHQADPWHVFLVQIAASVMARHPAMGSLPAKAAFWRSGLLDLAYGQPSAWELVVEDFTKPAFLQQPLKSAADRGTYQHKASAPDELDILVTAKDHDVKAARMDARDPQAWLFALLARQTVSGYLGRHYGSVRMNSGTGSRCIVSLVSSTAPSERFIEEVAVLREMRERILSNGVGYAARGVVLTWLAPWQREAAQWKLSQLEPWFIEAVRVIRLVRSDSTIHAMGTISAARQIGPKDADNGDIGDPWLPINVSHKKKGRSALTISASGWGPEMLCRMLFQQGIELTPLQRPRSNMTGSAWFIGSVLVRGEGTTEGFHRFALPLPARVRSWLSHADERERLGQLAKDLLADAKEIEKTLRGALIVLCQGGPETVDFNDDSLNAWSRAVVDAQSLGWAERFFPALWKGVDTDAAMIRTQWRADLIARARRALEEAQMRVPTPSSRHYRAQVRARGFLEGSFYRKGLVPEHTEPVAMTQEEPA